MASQMTMARFSRMQSRLHPVNTTKHIIDLQGGLVAGTTTSVVLGQGVDNPTLATPANVAVGSYIRSFFCNIQIAASGSGALANVYAVFWKNPSNAIGIAAPNLQGTSDTKKLVFHQEMTMTEKNTTAIARTLFKGVLKVPRHMQRMGQDDTLKVDLLSPGVNFDFCLQAIYKEIR